MRSEPQNVANLTFYDVIVTTFDLLQIYGSISTIIMGKKLGTNTNENKNCITL